MYSETSQFYVLARQASIKALHVRNWPGTVDSTSTDSLEGRAAYHKRDLDILSGGAKKNTLLSIQIILIQNW